MKTLKFFSAIIFSIFLLSFASAVVTSGQWEDGSISTSITNGDSVNFAAEGYSTYSSATINIDLYNSQGNKIHSFESNANTNKNELFSEAYTIDSSIYQNSGNYELIIQAFDNIPSSHTTTLYFTVNEIIDNQNNNAPQITSTPITEVNENSQYTYNVQATDADGDALTYSLTEAPNWLSINSVTGLMTGTAPEVASDQTYDISIRVSDGEDSTTQTYILRVINILATDTNAPIIEITNPENGQTYNSQQTTLTYTVNDAEGNLVDCRYSDGSFTSTWTTCSGAFTIATIEGSNTFTVEARDSFGNIGSDQTTFTIDTSTGTDTEAPGIIVITPEENEEYDDDDLTFEVEVNESATVTFSLDGNANITMNLSNSSNGIFTFTYGVQNLDEGNHEVIFYATDTAGNLATKTVEFRIDTTSSEDKDDDNLETNNYINDFGKTSEEKEYLKQFKPKTIYLDEEKNSEKLGWFKRFLRWLVNLFS